FFFSSRRRHTRSTRDWSSDVCSSDLQVGAGGREGDELAVGQADDPDVVGGLVLLVDTRIGVVGEAADAEDGRRLLGHFRDEEVQIGRASCREREWVWEVDVTRVRKKR